MSRPAGRLLVCKRDYTGPSAGHVTDLSINVCHHEGMPSQSVNTRLLYFCRPAGKLYKYSHLSDMTRKIKGETFTVPTSGDE